jgi:hypothetical protein
MSDIYPFVEMHLTISLKYLSIYINIHSFVLNFFAFVRNTYEYNSLKYFPVPLNIYILIKYFARIAFNIHILKCIQYVNTCSLALNIFENVAMSSHLKRPTLCMYAPAFVWANRQKHLSKCHVQIVEQRFSNVTLKLVELFQMSRANCRTLFFKFHVKIVELFSNVTCKLSNFFQMSRENCRTFFPAIFTFFRTEPSR